MRFKPMTEEEIQYATLLPEGKYKFHVVNSKDETSKNTGDDMIKLELAVTDKDGTDRKVFDYLLESMLYKMKHFCDATGLQNEYNEGVLNSGHCFGKSGLCHVIIQKDKTGQYPAKNTIKDYISESDRKEKIEKAGADEFKDDDLPF